MRYLQLFYELNPRPGYGLDGIVRAQLVLSRYG